MTRINQFLCTFALLAMLLILIPIPESNAQSTTDADQPVQIFLPQISSGADPAQVADDEEMLNALEEDIPVDDASAIAAATGLTLTPRSYRTLRGTDGEQPVSALAQCDSPNTNLNSDWEKYLEFYTPGSTNYIGYRTYTFPANVDPATINSLQITANYKGAARADQRWIWRILDWQQRKWILLGDNRAAASWQWSTLTFNAGGTLANYVNPTNRQIRVRVQSVSTSDDMDLDCESIVFTTNTPTPTPTPTPNTWWRPVPNTGWQIQLQGAVNTSIDVQVYFIDLFDVPQSKIQQLQSQGRKVVCYFSAGSYENWRPDAGPFPSAVLGAPLDNWPGERWLDIRNLSALSPIMTARMDLAVSKGCDGIDPDNVDGYSNESGFPLTDQNQLTYNRWLAEQAHARGLAIGLKNDLEQIPQLVNDFDWALNEQCFQYNECNLLLPFVQAGKPVFGIEYSGNVNVFCPKANALNFDFLKKALELRVGRTDCRTIGATATPTPTSTPATTIPLQVLIPLYNYPTTWNSATYIWDDVAAANSIVPITAIINPSDGPNGGAPNSDYAQGLNDLRTGGVKILGYVYTSYGARDMNAVKTDIDLYATYYNINGIFLDEVASGSVQLAYYTELYNYIHSKPGFAQAVLNPGTNTAQGYISQPAGDVTIIFENDSGWPAYSPDAYVATYSANRFAMLAYNVANANTMQSYVNLARQRNIGYLYITDDGADGNPWDELPTYWSTLLSAVAQP